MQNTVSRKLQLKFYSVGIIVIHHMYLHLCRKQKGQVQHSFQILEPFVGLKQWGFWDPAGPGLPAVVSGRIEQDLGPPLWPLGFRLTGSAGQDGEKTRAWKCSVKWFYHWLTRITEILLEELLKSLAVCFWANLSLVTLFSVSFPLLSSHTNSILIYIYLVM